MTLLLTIYVAGVAGCLAGELCDVWFWHEPWTAIVSALLWPVVLLAILIRFARDFIKARRA